MIFLKKNHQICFYFLLILIIFFIINFKKSYFQSNENAFQVNYNFSQLLYIEEIFHKYPCFLVDKEKSMELCSYQKKIIPKLGIFEDNFMTKETLHTARLYINTVKYSVLNLFFVYYDGLIDGSLWPPKGPCQALTMAGLRRLDNLQMVLEDVIVRKIKGDFIELGVWKGGLCILAKAILQAYHQYDRRVFLADSFEGIPPIDSKSYPIDKDHNGTDLYEIHTSNYTGGVQAILKNMKLFFDVEPYRNKISETSFIGLINQDNNLKEKEFQVKTEYLIGYFKDTLPDAIKKNKFKCFAVLRLDGDLYESTWQSLEHLYPYLNEGGIVIIDDFTDWVGAFTAVHDYRRVNNINTPIIQVYHGDGEIVRGAYFRKPHGSYVKSC